ncbi:hypothetical protein SAMN02982994_4315 [Azospirillum lipoferum]|nr:hypothetical protein SAMN02982994_4315 [Azospirillum lipoferum]
MPPRHRPCRDWCQAADCTPEHRHWTEIAGVMLLQPDRAPDGRAHYLLRSVQWVLVLICLSDGVSAKAPVSAALWRACLPRQEGGVARDNRSRLSRDVLIVDGGSRGRRAPCGFSRCPLNAPDSLRFGLEALALIWIEVHPVEPAVFADVFLVRLPLRDEHARCFELVECAREVRAVDAPIPRHAAERWPCLLVPIEMGADLDQQPPSGGRELQCGDPGRNTCKAIGCLRHS